MCLRLSTLYVRIFVGNVLENVKGDKNVNECLKENNVMPFCGSNHRYLLSLVHHASSANGLDIRQSGHPEKHQRCRSFFSSTLNVRHVFQSKK